MTQTLDTDARAQHSAVAAQPAGVPHPASVPQPAGVPQPSGAQRAASVPQHASAQGAAVVPHGVPQSAAVPQLAARESSRLGRRSFIGVSLGAAAAVLAGCSAGSSASRLEVGDQASGLADSAARLAGSGLVEPNAPADAAQVAGDQAGGAQDAAAPDERPLEDRVNERLAALTLEQRVAQLFFVRPESLVNAALGYEAGAEFDDSLDGVVSADVVRDALATWPVGGICLFGKNIVDEPQVTSLLAGLSEASQAAVGLRPFLAVDEEGGIVARISNTASFGIPNVGPMASIGASGDVGNAYQAGQTMAGYLGRMGFNLDFAPVCDVAGELTSTDESSRMFGFSADTVVPMVESITRGFLDTGMWCCAKHFPGIGEAQGDSHHESIYSTKTIDAMEQYELRPFAAAIAAGVPFVMVGHLTCFEATGSDIPASLNGVIVGDALRGRLGFGGVVLTDSLEMGAIIQRFGSADACVMALQAGIDMPLMPTHFLSAYHGVLAAVADGRLTPDRVDESLRRILRLKLA